MNTDYKEIGSFALNLVQIHKARLADSLLRSIHGEVDLIVEQSWLDEVQKRKKSLTNGEASLFEANEVITDANKHIKK